MSDHEHHESHGKTYFIVFLALCGFTAISVIADVFKPVGGHGSEASQGKFILGAIVLSVAVAKALCVMMFFMHLKFERAWKYLLLAPTIILAVALPLSLRPDIGETYYTPDVQQQRDFSEQEPNMHPVAHH